MPAPLGATVLRPVRWQRSSYSGGGGENCVELARCGAGVLLRESDAPRSAVLTSAARLAALLGEVKAGRLDRLTAARRE
ncbi:DUF397 domain-containing protein [Streptomyces litchfieldiae]|uniref:DUF397 domain-containing protein n=1 Tax=Streptomyces litchfieldiae TaxID=3075543 RepID=A0ABU2MNS0_9ACTN|nr:DUF397 domain-containing protein [Streptomyces sp. DSM 44938]MDT0343266.1 DUF397 domain-containing protein [Streptomyces sp. DSM 44938]